MKAGQSYVALPDERTKAMGSVRVMMLAGATAIMTMGAAEAADLPPIIHKAPPIPVEEFASGWYLRGDIGMSNQRVAKLDNALFATAPGLTWLDPGSFGAAPIFAFGVGYEFNKWLRVDVTGEYRGKSTFRALDAYPAGPGYGPGSNDYLVFKDEWVAMANAYIDLGTWWGLTPFVGAGAGMSYNRLSGFRDINVPNNAVAYGAEASKWNFAWALHAGVAYRVNSRFTVELAYRYIDLGDALTGDITTFTGINNVYNPMFFNGITSHDVKLGVRFMLNEPEVYAPPLMRKG